MVGVVNTTWGLSILTLLHLMLGMSLAASNLTAYASGAVLSYLLNRRYTFDAPQAGLHEFVQFVLCQGLSLGVMIIVVMTLTAHGVPFLVTQVLTLMLYSLTFFLLSEFIVFRRSQRWRVDSEVSKY